MSIKETAMDSGDGRDWQPPFAPPETAQEAAVALAHAIGSGSDLRPVRDDNADQDGAVTLYVPGVMTEYARLRVSRHLRIRGPELEVEVLVPEPLAGASAPTTAMIRTDGAFSPVGRDDLGDLLDVVKQRVRILGPKAWNGSLTERRNAKKRVMERIDLTEILVREMLDLRRAQPEELHVSFWDQRRRLVAFHPKTGRWLLAREDVPRTDDAAAGLQWLGASAGLPIIGEELADQPFTTAIEEFKLAAARKLRPVTRDDFAKIANQMRKRMLLDPEAIDADLRNFWS